jgi:hypothetical protein
MRCKARVIGNGEVADGAEDHAHVPVGLLVYRTKRFSNSRPGRMRNNNGENRWAGHRLFERFVV